MSKWNGIVGYWTDESFEVKPGVWKSGYVTRKYRGDLLENNYRWANRQNGTNDSLELTHQISIVADPFAQKNYRFIRYVEFGGCKWTVTNIRLQYPRLIMSIGGIYNANPD